MISDIEELRSKFAAGGDLKACLTALFASRANITSSSSSLSSSASSGPILSALRTAETILHCRSTKFAILAEADVTEECVDNIKFDLTLLRSFFNITVAKDIIPQLALPKDLLTWLNSIILCKSGLIDSQLRVLTLHVCASILKNFKDIPFADIVVFSQGLVACIAESSRQLSLFYEAQSNDDPHFAPGAIFLSQSVDCLMSINAESIELGSESSSSSGANTASSTGGSKGKGSDDYASSLFNKFAAELSSAVPLAVSLLDVTAKIKISNCFVNASKLFSVLTELILMASTKIPEIKGAESSSRVATGSLKIISSFDKIILSNVEAIVSAISSLNTLHDSYLLCFQSTFELFSSQLRTSLSSGGGASSTPSFIEAREMSIDIILKKLDFLINCTFSKPLGSTEVGKLSPSTDASSKAQANGDSNGDKDGDKLPASASGASSMALRRMEMLLNCVQCLYQHSPNPSSLESVGDASSASGANLINSVGILEDGSEVVTKIVDVVEKVILSLCKMLADKSKADSKSTAKNSNSNSSSNSSSISDLRIVCGDIRKASIIMVDEILSSNPSWVMSNLERYWILCTKTLSTPLVFGSFFKAAVVVKSQSQTQSVHSRSGSEVELEMADRILSHLVLAVKSCSRYSAQSAFDILQSIMDIYSTFSSSSTTVSAETNVSVIGDMQLVQSLLKKLPELIAESIAAYRKGPRFKLKSSKTSDDNGDDDNTLTPMAWKGTLLSSLEVLLQFNWRIATNDRAYRKQVGSSSAHSISSTTSSESAAAVKSICNSATLIDLLSFLCGDIEALHKLQGRTLGPKGLGAVGVGISDQMDSLGYGDDSDDEVLSDLLTRLTVALNALLNLVTVDNDVVVLPAASKDALQKLFLLHQSIVNRKIKYQDDEEQICLELQSLSLMGFAIWSSNDTATLQSSEILDAAVRSICKVVQAEPGGNNVLNAAANDALLLLQTLVESSDSIASSTASFTDSSSSAAAVAAEAAVDILTSPPVAPQSRLFNLLSESRKGDLQRTLAIRI